MVFVKKVGFFVPVPWKWYLNSLKKAFSKNLDELSRIMKRYDLSSLPIKKRRKLMVELPSTGLGNIISLELLSGMEF